MACTYDYQTGQITLDFHFVEWGTKCLFSGLPAKAGNKRCEQCPHYGGLLTCATLGVEYWGRFNEVYIRCKHSEAKDSEGCETARSAFYEAFINKALCHYYD